MDERRNKRKTWEQRNEIGTKTGSSLYIGRFRYEISTPSHAIGSNSYLHISFLIFKIIIFIFHIYKCTCKRICNIYIYISIYIYIYARAKVCGMCSTKTNYGMCNFVYDFLFPFSNFIFLIIKLSLYL